jgi:cytoskeletal protein CcmA (bactofilin family)
VYVLESWEINHRFFGESEMFKRPEGDYQTKRPEGDQPLPEPLVPHIPVPRGNPTDTRRENATIGASISIKGDLMGEEDLVIQGRVEGKVDLKQNTVTVGKNGRVKADIYGKLVTIEGEVEGNLFGQDQIIVRGTGNVRGNVSAPRISIEDGARFKGSIDMDGNSGDKLRASAAAESKVPAPGLPGSDQTPKGGQTIRTEVPTIRVG